MSHYPVAVIYDPTEQCVESLLEPFNENLKTDFCNVERSLKCDWENGVWIATKDKNGKYQQVRGYSYPTDDAEEVSAKDLWDTFEDFVADATADTDIENDPELGLGYWYNDEAKWDWYDEDGGRFYGYLRDDDYNPVTSLLVDEWSTKPDVEHYQQTFNSYVGRWNDMMDSYSEAKDWTSREYMLDRYVNADTYAMVKMSHIPYAVVTPDGLWHAPGEMCWFGFSTETGSELMEWNGNFEETFVKPYSGHGYIVKVVDCHI